MNDNLLLQSIEVLNDDANDKVESEERAEDDKDDKIAVIEERGLVLRLLINLRHIHRVLHDLLPPIEGGLEGKILTQLWPVSGLDVEDCSEKLLRQHSYVIKNQLVASKAPY